MFHVRAQSIQLKSDFMTVKPSWPCLILKRLFVESVYLQQTGANIHTAQFCSLGACGTDVLGMQRTVYEQ